MKRIYRIPRSVICIKNGNDLLIYCNKENLTKSLSKYDIKVSGDGKLVELPRGWEVYDEDKKSIVFVDQYDDVRVTIKERTIYT